MKRAFDVPVKTGQEVSKKQKIESNIQNDRQLQQQSGQNDRQQQQQSGQNDRQQQQQSGQNDRQQPSQNDRQQPSLNDRQTSPIIGFGHLMNSGFSTATDFSSDFLPSNLNVWSSVCRNQNPKQSSWNHLQQVSTPEGPRPGTNPIKSKEVKKMERSLIKSELNIMHNGIKVIKLLSMTNEGYGVLNWARHF